MADRRPIARGAEQRVQATAVIKQLKDENES